MRQRLRPLLPLVLSSISSSTKITSSFCLLPLIPQRRSISSTSASRRNNWVRVFGNQLLLPKHYFSSSSTATTTTTTRSSCSNDNSKNSKTITRMVSSSDSSIAAATTTDDNGDKKEDLPLPSISSRVRNTFDPCVVLMKELMGRYGHLWEDRGGIYSLAQGVVYWRPPESATRAMVASISSPDGATHAYGPDEGLEELRTKLREKLRTENGFFSSSCGVNHDVMVTVGANQAYVNCVLTLLEQSQKCVVFRPYYFNHVMAIQMSLPPESLVVGPSCIVDGGSCVPDLDWLERSLEDDPSINVVTIVNPGNPTGVVLSREVLRRAVDLCGQHRCWLVLDCTYEYFVVDNGDAKNEFCCFPHDPHVVHIFSFSKSYALAGYRCGYVVLPQSSGNKKALLMDEMLKVQDTIPIAPSRIAQIAALGAMEEGGGKPWVLERYQTLERGRKAILEALGPCETVIGGTGAMYVMAKLNNKTSGGDVVVDDKEFCRKLVEEHGVAVIPGSFCGFPGWIRVCYSNLPPDECLRAANRLERGIRELLLS